MQLQGKYVTTDYTDGHGFFFWNIINVICGCFLCFPISDNIIVFS